MGIKMNMSLLLIIMNSFRKEKRKKKSESSFMWLKFHFQMQQRPISQIPISPTPLYDSCHRLMIFLIIQYYYVSLWDNPTHFFCCCFLKVREFIETMKPSPLFRPKPITIIRTQPLLFFTQTPKFTSNVKPTIFQFSPHSIRHCPVSMSTRSVHSSSPVIKSDVQRPDSGPSFLNSTEEHVEKVLATTNLEILKTKCLTCDFISRCFHMYFMYVCIYVNVGYLWMSFLDASGSLGVFSWIVFMFYQGMPFSFHDFIFWHCKYIPVRSYYIYMCAYTYVCMGVYIFTHKYMIMLFEIVSIWFVVLISV